MPGKPYIHFYPGDWSKDPAVSRLSLAARGLWFEMILAMHESDTPGRITLTPAELSRVCRCTPSEARRLLAEMERAGTFDREGDTYISRKMERRAEISGQRSKAGRKGADLLWQNDSKHIGKIDDKISDLPSTLTRARAADSDYDKDKQRGSPRGDDAFLGAGFDSAEDFEAWFLRLLNEHVNKSRNGIAKQEALDLILRNVFKRKEFEEWYRNKKPDWAADPPRYTPNLAQLFADTPWRFVGHEEPENKRETPEQREARWAEEERCS